MTYLCNCLNLKRFIFHVVYISDNHCLVCLPVRYAATIERIDYDKEQVLIHYRQWSRRHDEWFHWSSPYLRPLERVSLRRQGRNAPQSEPVCQKQNTKHDTTKQSKSAFSMKDFTIATVAAATLNMWRYWRYVLHT